METSVGAETTQLIREIKDRQDAQRHVRVLLIEGGLVVHVTALEEDAFSYQFAIAPEELGEGFDHPTIPKFVQRAEPAALLPEELTT